MIFRKLALFSIVLFVPTSQSYGDDTKPEVTDRSLLTGEWQLEEYKEDGFSILTSEAIPSRLIFPETGNYYDARGTNASRGYRLSITLESNKSPKEFDVHLQNELGGWEPVGIGIYKIEGDKLTRCFVNSGSIRPADFKATVGNMFSLHRRVSKDKKSKPKKSIPSRNTKQEQTKLSDKEALHGTWSPLSFTTRSFPMESQFKGLHLKFDKDSDFYRVNRPNVTFRFKYKLYPDKNPKEFDIWYIGTESKTEKYDPEKPYVQGIYRIEGNRLIRCYAAREDHARPTEFKSPIYKPIVMTVHKRVPTEKLNQDGWPKAGLRRSVLFW